MERSWRRDHPILPDHFPGPCRDGLSGKDAAVALDDSYRRQIVSVHREQGSKQPAPSSFGQGELEGRGSKTATPKGRSHVVADVTPLDRERGGQLEPKANAGHDLSVAVVEPELRSWNPAGRSLISVAVGFELCQVHVEVVERETITIVSVIAPVLSHARESGSVARRGFEELQHGRIPLRQRFMDRRVDLPGTAASSSLRR